MPEMGVVAVDLHVSDDVAVDPDGDGLARQAAQTVEVDLELARPGASLVPGASMAVRVVAAGPLRACRSVSA